MHRARRERVRNHAGAWAKFAMPGEKLDLTEAPSEAFDGRQVALLMGESRPDDIQN